MRKFIFFILRIKVFFRFNENREARLSIIQYSMQKIHTYDEIEFNLELKKLLKNNNIF